MCQRVPGSSPGVGFLESVWRNGIQPRVAENPCSYEASPVRSRYDFPNFEREGGARDAEGPSNRLPLGFSSGRAKVSEHPIL